MTVLEFLKQIFLDVVFKAAVTPFSFEVSCKKTTWNGSFNLLLGNFNLNCILQILYSRFTWAIILNLLVHCAPQSQITSFIVTVKAESSNLFYSLKTVGKRPEITCKVISHCSGLFANCGLNCWRKKGRNFSA